MKQDIPSKKLVRFRLSATANRPKPYKTAVPTSVLGTFQVQVSPTEIRLLPSVTTFDPLSQGLKLRKGRMVKFKQASLDP